MKQEVNFTGLLNPITDFACHRTYSFSHYQYYVNFAAKFNEEKEALEDHKQKLKDIIDACKLLYDNFDEKRREVSI